ncbi:hypothetical protein WJX75_007001 [Coccomyxa subellipsoidea]|uniref:Snurportin-1 n=1 Tax=Coccomyxa subellipsoidea TaxID=248742 RepID=A0ABR2YVS7_9CHLO
MKRYDRQSRISQFQERRRSEALSRQRAARRNLTAQVRQLALSEHSNAAFSAASQVQAPGDDSLTTSSSAHAGGEEVPTLLGTHGSGLRSFFSNQLMQHEWLTDIPGDLASNWVVMPRPEGQRCLVIASHQHTVSRTRSGSILHSFPSPLPGGSRATHGNAEVFSILDTVFSEPDKTYFVIDIMAWNGYLLYDCNADFRTFWVQSKLAEIAEGIQAAYSGMAPFQQRDGLLFLNREAHYDLGSSPLALLWKDAHSSRYFLDTDAAGVVPDWLHIVLQCLDNGHVGTGDDPPIIVGTVPQDLLQNKPDQSRHGRLLRFTVREGGLILRDGELVSADLRFEGLANQRRGRADLCSKIVFQHLARNNPITLAMLLDVCGHSDSELGDACKE